MLQAFFNSLSAIFVLLCIIGVGYWTAHRGWFDEKGKSLIARLVNFSIPCFLFYSVTSKFSHDELMELLKIAALPFLTVGINFLLSVFFVKLGLVRKEIQGAFIATSTGATVLFVGVPLSTAMFGDRSLAYLLVYFFANVVFIWTIGLYCIQLDGVNRRGGEKPSFFSAKSLRMLFSPPLLSFILGVACVILALPIPSGVHMVTRYLGQIATPLALIFVGITVYKVGFVRLLHMPREIWLVLASCYVIRPLAMYLCTLPLDMEPLMRQVFVVASSLPVSSVLGVLSRNYGADDEFASSAVGLSTVAFLFVLPVLLTLVGMIQ